LPNSVALAHLHPATNGVMTTVAMTTTGATAVPVMMIAGVHAADACA